MQGGCAAGEPPAERRAPRALVRRCDARGAAQLGAHLGALLATGAGVAAARGSAWLWPAMALHGVVLAFLFAALHETVHRTAFARRALNDAVARICGLLLLLPRDYFRAFHFAHHRYTQDPARDPELLQPKPASLPAYLASVSGLPYWAERVRTLLRHAAGRVDETFIAPRLRRRVVAEARLSLALYALAGTLSALSGSTALLLFWIGPALLGMPALRLYLLAEHSGCPYVPQMLRNSRTTHTTWLLRRLAWNMPFHAEHHAFPAIPFHALPRAHALLADRIEVQAPGYLSVHRELVAACRRGRPLAAPR